jgi:hypothetical protein
MEAICDAMVQFYKKTAEKYEHLYNRMIQERDKYRNDYTRLRRQYYVLEDYSHTQELRADAMHDVLERFIESLTGELRMELADHFRVVARERDIDLDELDIEVPPPDDWSVHSLSDSESLDLMFD